MQVSRFDAGSSSAGGVGALTVRHQALARRCLLKALETLEYKRRQRHTGGGPEPSDNGEHDAPALADGVIWRVSERPVPDSVGESAVVFYLSAGNLKRVNVTPEELLAEANRVASSATEGAGGTFSIGETREHVVPASELAHRTIADYVGSSIVVKLPMTELRFVPWSPMWQSAGAVAGRILPTLTVLGLLLLALVPCYGIAVLTGRVTAFLGALAAVLIAGVAYAWRMRPRTAEARLAELNKLAARATYDAQRTAQ